MKNDTIEALRECLVGRRVVKIEERVYLADADYDRDRAAGYPVLYLDDGSEVVLLTDDGAPPISEVEKGPHVDAKLWEGDQA